MSRSSLALLWVSVLSGSVAQAQQDAPAAPAAARQFSVAHDYLLLPIQDGGPRRVVTALVDGQVVVRNDVELAEGAADWWAAMDVRRWRGQTLVLRVDGLPAESPALAAITPSDSLRGDVPTYDEPLRGQFHFSSRRGWNNDPNGLSYYGGEWHLFYQHNPYGWGWGNMHWGHATSSDLVHWHELSPALLPDRLGPMFSGSAVVDWQNTSGFGSEGHPAQVLVYTAAGDPAVQCLAFSTDGRTYTKFAGNPVVANITPGNRDPKVFWHAATQRWVMALYVEVDKVHCVQFLGSPNLREWQQLSRIGGFFECPDLFPLPVDGDAARTEWVLTAASSEYMVGDFDGTTFVPATAKLPGHRGRGFYAAQTFGDVPARDGRRIQIGWFQTETRGMPFNQSMTIPLELGLVTTPEGPRMTWTPVRELASLRARTHAIPAQELTPDAPNPLAGVAAEVVELRAEFSADAGGAIEFTVRGIPVTWTAATQVLRVGDHEAPAPAIAGRQRLIVYCDRTGLEVFASDGRCYVPMPTPPATEDQALAVCARGGPARFASLQVYELASAWDAGPEAAK